MLLLHNLIMVLTAAVLAASDADAAPAQVAIVRLAGLAPDPDDSGPLVVHALSGIPAEAMDSPDAAGVVLVPVEAAPLTVSDDKEEAGGAEGEDDGDPWEALAGLLGMSEATDAAPASAESPFDSFFSSFESLQSSPTEAAEDGDGGSRVAVIRVGRGLKSVPDAFGEIQESRVLDDLEDDGSAVEAEDDDVGGGSDQPRAAHRRPRRALRLLIRRPRQDDDVADHAAAAGGHQEGRAGRADAAPAPAPGSFLETVQNQLPPQLQGLGGAMEDSQMVVGTFQAIIMPGSAATDLGQQIQGFISNMPQVPQLPAGTG